MANPYKDQLDSLLTNPSGYSGSPGFQFAMDSGMQGVERGMSTQRGSGNALAALSKYGTGLAQQDYGAQVDRLGKLSGQEQSYDLGLGQNQNTATRNANDLTLGNAQNVNNANRNNNDMNLGMYRAGNDFSLGQATNATNLQRNYWDNQNNQQQNANNAANNQNNYNSNMYRNQTDQYNAVTNRGNGQSSNYLNLLRLRGGH